VADAPRTDDDVDELRDSESMALYRDLLRAMYVMFKSAFVYATNNDTLRVSCERVATAANRICTLLDDQASLELLGEGAYVNKTLIKLDTSLFDQSDYLFAIFSTLGISAISAIDQTGAADWLEIVAAFQRAVGPGGDFQTFAKTSLPKLRITSMQGAGAKSGLVATARFRALRAYATTVITINEVLDALRTGRRLRPMWVKRPIQEMVSLAVEAGPMLLALTHLKRHKISVAHHLTNTAVYAICSAQALGLPRRLIAQLAMEAALHDVGRAFVAAPEKAAHSVAERRFALESVRRLVTAGSVNDRMMARVVMTNEVRRWAARRAEPPGDTAYPFALAGRSRLLAVAHAYSMLTLQQQGRPALLPDEALRVIVAEGGRRYDPTAVRLIVNALGVYPVGSTVALDDGRVAVVVEATLAAGGATRPRVKIVREVDGSIVDGALVDLAGDAGARTRVQQCIDGEALEINAPAFLLS
jgi:HD-GYP domain-containing protein (c-di-GMP phosphodiesterase class II)